MAEAFPLTFERQGAQVFILHWLHNLHSCLVPRWQEGPWCLWGPLTCGWKLSNVLCKNHFCVILPATLNRLLLWSATYRWGSQGSRGGLTRASWNVIKLILGYDLSVSKPQARPTSGISFCRCANSIHLGSLLCQMCFPHQFFNLQVPGTLSPLTVSNTSQRCFHIKVQREKGLGGETRQRQQILHVLFIPRFFLRFWPRSYLLGYADQSQDTYLLGWSGIEVLIIFSICL